MTLPVILAAGQAGEEERRFWRKTIEVGMQEEGDLSAPSNIWSAAGRFAETIERARRYARDARDVLDDCAKSEIKSALADIADFVVERAY